MKPLLISLPDDLPTWRGTAADLAVKGNELLPLLNIASDGSLNERLVRYYVTEKLLTPPEREGKEAIFGFRQVIELLVIRYLLQDQWSLAKIRDIVQSVDLEALQGLLPPEPAPTAAEQAVSRIRGGRRRPGKDDAESFVARERASPYRVEPRPNRPTADKSGEPRARSYTALDLAAGTTLRRTVIRDGLEALGAPRGEVERRMSMRYALTPWCQMVIDLSALRTMPDDAPETLGAALTQLLREERNKRGGRP